MLIVCNGMPRSGSTLIYNLVRIYLEQQVELETLGFFSDDDLSAQEELLRQKAENTSCALLKTHFAFNTEITQVLEIYTIRDPRDIAVSMMRIWGFSAEKAMRSLAHHVEIAETYQNRSDIFFLPYEMIQRDYKSLLTGVSAFIGKPFCERSATVALSAVDDMRKKSRSQRLSKVKKALHNFFKSANRKFRIGKLLKSFLPYSLVTRLRDRVLFIDRKTMLHPSHVGGSIQDESTLEVRQSVETTFETWMKRNDYLSNDEKLIHK